MASEPDETGIGSILHPVGETEDIYGDGIEFFVTGDEVHIEFPGASVVLGPDEREPFQKLFMEAEHRAEAYAAQHPEA